MSEPQERPERPDREPARDKRTGRAAASERMRNQAKYVDLEVQRAMERGEFDDLPGAGKPLKLPDRHDPDWWLKQLIERENISGVARSAGSTAFGAQLAPGRRGRGGPRRGRAGVRASARPRRPRRASW